MKKDIVERILELIKEDPELHVAVLAAINAHAEADRALTRWRDRRR